MRVESDRPMKNGGWFHKNLDRNGARREPATRLDIVRHETPIHDFSKLIETWQSQRNGEVEPYAATLGVDKQALLDLGACYAKEYRAFAFPMYLPNGDTVGIRLRSDAKKWAVKGSRQALFIPFDACRRISAQKLLIVEGPTDAAAGLTLGFFTVGRPNCSGCVDLIVELVRDLNVREVVIVCDNDSRWTEIQGRWQYIEPGIRGAETLAQALPCRTVRVVLPTKDLRSFVQAGGTRELFESLTKNCLQTR